MKGKVKIRRRGLERRIQRLEEEKRQKARKARYTSVLAVPIEIWEQGSAAREKFIQDSGLLPEGSGFLVVPEPATTTDEWINRLKERKAKGEPPKPPPRKDDPENLIRLNKP